MALTTQSFLSPEKDLSVMEDNGSPVLFDFNSLSKSKITSSFDNSILSKFNASIVWPLCPVISRISNATLKPKSLIERFLLSGQLLKSLKTNETSQNLEYFGFGGFLS